MEDVNCIFNVQCLCLVLTFGIEDLTEESNYWSLQMQMLMKLIMDETVPGTFKDISFQGNKFFYDVDLRNNACAMYKLE